VKDVERNSSISNEGVTHLTLADADVPARVRLKLEIGDARQVRLSPLRGLAPKVLEAVDSQRLAGFEGAHVAPLLEELEILLLQVTDGRGNEF
jgi:hypothetical protein